MTDINPYHKISFFGTERHHQYYFVKTRYFSLLCLVKNEAKLWNFHEVFQSFPSETVDNHTTDTTKVWRWWWETEVTPVPLPLGQFNVTRNCGHGHFREGCNLEMEILHVVDVQNVQSINGLVWRSWFWMSLTHWQRFVCLWVCLYWRIWLICE